MNPPAPNPQLRRSPQYRDLMEGLGEKLVTAVPGIDDATQRNLAENEITRASQLLEKYLQNPLNFRPLLIETFGVDVNDADFAYISLCDFSRINFLPDILPRRSAKYRALMEGPLGEKRVTAVPCIGRAAKRRLAVNGITRASQLLEIFLRDPRNFQSLLEETYRVHADHAELAYNALRDFSRIYIFEH